MCSSPKPEVKCSVHGNSRAFCTKFLCDFGVNDSSLHNDRKACIDQNVTCYFIPHIGDVIIAGAKHVQSFSIPIMETGRAVLSPEYALIKRAMDIVCSTLALVVLSPFMLATAIVP